jgi:hypothetical protein
MMGTYLDVAGGIGAIQGATDWDNVVPDTPFTKYARAIYVGVSGDVAVTGPSGNKIFKNVQAGSYLQLMGATVVTAAGTTATNMIVLY